MSRFSRFNEPQTEPALPEPTTLPGPDNRRGWHCRDCGELYYVDEATYLNIAAAIEHDPTENPFCCRDCEEADARAAHP